MHSFTQFEEEERKRRKRERERGERPKQFVLLGPGHKVFVTLTLAGWPDDLMGRMCHSWGWAVGWLCWGQYKLNRRRMVKKPSRIGSCFLQSSAKKTCARETDFFCKVFSSQLKGMSDCRREPSHGNGLKETRKENKTKKDAMQQRQESGWKSGNPKRNIPQLLLPSKHAITMFHISYADSASASLPGRQRSLFAADFFLRCALCTDMKWHERRSKKQ